jgi:transcriptional regulator with XRE-family HTH domain
METGTAPTLGSRIRRARERKRWTQQELADAVEVSRDAVVRWENDQRTPRNRIGALEEVLGIDLTSVPA